MTKCLNQQHVLLCPVFIVQFVFGNFPSEHFPSPSVLNQMERQRRNRLQRLEEQEIHVHICTLLFFFKGSKS